MVNQIYRRGMADGTQSRPIGMVNGKMKHQETKWTLPKTTQCCYRREHGQPF
jgi:hypothetical protein